MSYRIIQVEDVDKTYYEIQSKKKNPRMVGGSSMYKESYRWTTVSYINGMNANFKSRQEAEATMLKIMKRKHEWSHKVVQEEKQDEAGVK